MVNGIGITKEGSFTGMMNIINKRLKQSQKLRPSLDIYQSYGQGYGSHSGKGGPAGYIPYYRIGSQSIESLAFQSDIFMTTINALKNKIFRRGFKIEERVDNPDKTQLKILNGIIKNINQNGQSLKELIKMFEQDENIFDDGYLIAMNDYIFGPSGDIISTAPQEIIKASPTVIAIIADSEGRLGYTHEGKKVFVDPETRNRLITEEEAKTQGFKNRDGIKLQPAHHRAITYYKNERRDIFYLPGEVFHLSKHNPTAVNGMSPVHSIWMKMITLIEQDRYLLLNYQKGRPPRGMLIISTTNYTSAKAAWESLKAETRKDPHSISPYLMGDKDGKGKVEWIEFMRPLGDMQFIESRNEMRRQIGAIYGVMPLFSGDLSQSGGLNNEGLQITVTNQAVEEGQKLYNDKVFPWILKQFGITDYKLELEEPEEKDEVIDAKIRGIKIDNATKMAQMGFDVSYNKQDDEFEFSEEATTPVEGGGMFGGSSETKLNDQELEKHFFKVLKTQSERDLMKDAYDMISRSADEEGLEFDIQKQGLEEFIALNIFKRKFEGLSKTKSNKIKSIILKAILAKDSITEVANKIKDAGVDKQQAELIARTESSILKNATREFNFSRARGSSDFVYKWIGPDDRRTSDISKEIKTKSRKGLKLETLKSLVRKTSEKFGFTPDRDWFSHPNQRHTFTRVI